MYDFYESIQQECQGISLIFDQRIEMAHKDSFTVYKMSGLVRPVSDIEPSERFSLTLFSREFKRQGFAPIFSRTATFQRM